MSQNAGGVYTELSVNNSYHSKQNRETYLEYPVSASKKQQMLIKELADMWILDIKNFLRPSSYAHYQNNIEKFILPYIGEMPVSSFNASVLSETLNILKKENREEAISQYTLYLLENIVRSMFRYGAEKGFVPEISFGKAEYKIKSKKEALPLSELEMHQLIHALERQENDIKIQVLLPFYTGIALSELCGLKWKDIDLESGKIHIRRNLIRVQQKAEDLKRNTKVDENPKAYSGNDNRSVANSKKNGQRQMATILVECELPENECREFIMPEKLYHLLKTVYLDRKPEQESYVAEVDKKAGRKRNVSLVEIVKKGNCRTDVAKESTVQSEPPDGRTLQYRVKVLGETVWIEDLNFQRLRDTFVVMCLQAGGDIYSMAYVLGVGVTAVYDKYKDWLVRKDGFLKGIG